jgi:hypothetical protein
MVRKWILFLGLLSASPVWAAGETPSEGRAGEIVLAKPYPLDRYQALMDTNPFTLIKPETEEVKGFAKNLSVTSVMRTNGKIYASLFDSETKERFRVSEEVDEKSQMAIVSAVLGGKPKDVSLQIKKGEETATVTFNMEALELARAPVAPVAGGPPGRPPAGRADRGGGPPGASPAGDPNQPRPRVIRRVFRRTDPVPGQNP